LGSWKRHKVVFDTSALMMEQYCWGKGARRKGPEAGSLTQARKICGIVMIFATNSGEEVYLFRESYLAAIP